jgi:periplasmic divalent cation tolerance protein
MTDDQAGEDVEICEIIITAPNAEWLAAFCRNLIEDHLAAAVHIIEDIRTLYRWQGEINDTHEARAHIRTRRAYSDAIFERVLSMHPYDVPSVVVLDITTLNPAYQHWVVTQTEDSERSASSGRARGSQ